MSLLLPFSRLLNAWPVAFWPNYRFNRYNGMLEDQELPFGGLELDRIGIVALDCPGNWLTSRDKADSDLLALERRG